eukprot:Protomagalhaensia_wolfi_Nauph_80__1452@NODE_1876_length_1292_cov_887_282522_g25_i1_p1_GENE_NODE_1876_length_1292_cov_887_282522_g25_i1NODE_1876_length_1292_cov_887_282522_g25_i1_p1_ORF_typecomplete_len297_score67_03PNP_UDP_1/PF01048_20/9e25_NODE_1876_length_1292_cov_887_282522_g25_i12041094
MTPKLGVIGGTGLENLGSEEKENVTQLASLDFSHWGNPSAVPVPRLIGNAEAILLSRHGKGHHIPPHQVNYRGNIAAIKICGVTHLMSFCAVGSLNPEMPPGTFVLVEQYIDRTKATRPTTFFEGPAGVVAHVSLADPTCRAMNQLVEEAAATVPGLTFKTGGQLVVIDGPQFSTRAEARMHRQWGCNLVGMTTVSECRLAREAELCYTNVAMVTDFDCIDEVDETVSSHSVEQFMKKNVHNAQRLIEAVAVRFAKGTLPCTQGCQTVLKHAVCSAMPEDKSSLAKFAVLNKEIFG